MYQGIVQCIEVLYNAPRYCTMHRICSQLLMTLVKGAYRLTSCPD